MEQKPFIRVAVGVILNTDDQVLLAQRPDDKPWSGWWEFPGGKIEDGESVHDALKRELKEELDIDIAASEPWVSFIYEYPKTTVELSFRKVYQWTGEIKGLEKQAFAWTTPNRAHELGELLPASVAPIQWLQWGDYYALSHFQNPELVDAYWTRLDKLLAKGVKLFQFREPTWPEGASSENLRQLCEEMVTKCHAHGAKVLINSTHPRAWYTMADGVHYRANDAVQLEERPVARNKLMAVSCHHLADVLYASHIGADFLVLGHVLPTPSHEGQAPLGWEQFAQFAAEAARPVYAIGGQNSNTLATAKAHGAQGVATLRGDV